MTPSRILKGLYFWTIAVLFTVFFFTGVMLMKFWLVLTGRPDETKPLHRICSNWGRSLLRLTPGWRVEITGAENIPSPSEPFVVVANHESMADIWAMFCLDLQFRWLSKEEIFKIPLVGAAMRWTGYVPILRGNRDSHTLAMAASAERLRAGLSMFFFPEGTRTRDGAIQPFKNGAFKLARDEQVRILPVAIHGARDLLPKGSMLPGRSVVKVRVLPPMPAPPRDGQSLDAVASAVRSQIVAAHNQLL
jgi:1-acyl-sn-glycerol-3-phosphate acyltransferase